MAHIEIETGRVDTRVRVDGAAVAEAAREIVATAPSRARELAAENTPLGRAIRRELDRRGLR